MSTAPESRRETTILDALQREAFCYFQHETNPANGLVLDKTRPGWPASIAAVGLGLTCYPVAVERGLVSRPSAVQTILATLRFFERGPQGTGPDAIGYHGFYYHFLDLDSGRRAHGCEVSTVDTALLLGGMLTVAAYFTRNDADEREIRELADRLYRRVDWQWAMNGGPGVVQGWLPESGFVDYRYQGYDEALILYLLGLGAPAGGLPESSYADWCATYEWKRCYDIEFLYAGPLFIHHLSHVWVDFRGIQDAYMRNRGIDYFENSRRATWVQQRYAIANPQGFRGYGEHAWGITASDGPGDLTLRIDGVERRFYDYVARGVPIGPDDGTLAPWAVVSSLPFAPEVVLPTIERMDRPHLRGQHPYGFKATFNATYPAPDGSSTGWVSSYHFGINQAPMMLMIENYRTGMIWELMRSCPYLRDGLRRSGFSGGWL